ncbi:MAG: 50S ribosomal protein L23 [Kiritimatiellae bacterium]|jgi:large subunit ribosomal protein L23|nr:50S ribosomal protein L23 [Kiritimatiellia bacterium]
MTTIIRKVSVTEKGAIIGANNQYMLEVAPSATKPEIRAAVEAQFGVHVVSVNTANYRSRTVATRTRRTTTTQAWKRAIVTLRDGERIEIV